MDLSQIAKQLGRRGGKKTLENKGLDYFKELSKKGVEARKMRINRVNNSLVDN